MKNRNELRQMVIDAKARMLRRLAEITEEKDIDKCVSHFDRMSDDLNKTLRNMFAVRGKVESQIRVDGIEYNRVPTIPFNDDSH